MLKNQVWNVTRNHNLAHRWKNLWSESEWRCEVFVGWGPKLEEASDIRTEITGNWDWNQQMDLDKQTFRIFF